MSSAASPVTVGSFVALVVDSIAEVGAAAKPGLEVGSAACDCPMVEFGSCPILSCDDMVVG